MYACLTFVKNMATTEQSVQQSLTPQLYQSIYQSASTLTDYLGIDAAIKALEVTSRILSQPTIFADVRQQAEQDIPNTHRRKQLGDAMVIIFHGHPRYPIASTEPDHIRRQKMHIMERIRDYRGMTTNSLTESLLEDMAVRYVRLQEGRSQQAMEIRSFIEDVFTPGKTPEGLGGMVSTVRRLRHAFWHDQAIV